MFVDALLYASHHSSRNANELRSSRLNRSITRPLSLNRYMIRGFNAPIFCQEHEDDRKMKECDTEVLGTDLRLLSTWQGQINEDLSLDVSANPKFALEHISTLPPPETHPKMHSIPIID